MVNSAPATLEEASIPYRYHPATCTARGSSESSMCLLRAITVNSPLPWVATHPFSSFEVTLNQPPSLAFPLLASLMQLFVFPHLVCLSTRTEIGTVLIQEPEMQTAPRSRGKQRADSPRVSKSVQPSQYLDVA